MVCLCYATYLLYFLQQSVGFTVLLRTVEKETSESALAIKLNIFYCYNEEWNQTDTENDALDNAVYSNYNQQILADSNSTTNSTGAPS